MANALYAAGKRALMNKQIDLVNDTINIALVNTAYTYNVGDSSYTTSISTPGYTVGTPVALSGKVVSDFGTPNSSPANAVFDADDPTFTAVASGSTVESCVIYHASSGTLIAYIDVGTGLPFSTNGGNVTINFSSSITRIFAL
jgi:hypothetical protein